MSKITFRADDDLVAQLEALEASKSEAMREALRAYLEDEVTRGSDARSDAEREHAGAIDDLVRDRVDDRLDTRLRELGLDRASTRARGSISPQDLTISISLDGPTYTSDERGAVDVDRTRETAGDDQQPAQSHESTASQPRDGGVQCNQCGDRLEGDHVYCPNCGEKASRRLFCECGDEIRSDWSFCPCCGRRTPAADVLESESTQY
ncbi:ribbon-helix-helix protein, CopG family [Haloterrigena sp. H1]|uniref:ribbon-helix-helix protein, CopG family n=1 Tax=Haloterrigena sp. H1 TaxID=2552943 RepID=UPI00110F1BA1|nr:ribbon-helix-helix protein, CopG family [Haloterrigena sp. H1]TMT87438.1 ribbon-helix-helix protein, CopG family [Haloterrigena sp. H1]